jgi:WD40 repeat protein
VFLWDYASASEIKAFEGSKNIWQVAFSPDGKLAVGVEDHVATHIWDVESGQEVRRLVVNAGSDAAFSPDGRQIATTFNAYQGNGGNNNPFRAIIYDTDIHDFIARACATVTRDFTADERTHYGLTGSAPTCPQFAQGYALPTGMAPMPTAMIPVWTPMPTLEATPQ